MSNGRSLSVAPTSYVDQSVRSLSKTKEYLSDGMDIATLISMQYAKIGKGRCSNVEQLKNDVVEYAQMEAEMERTTSALREIQTQLKQADPSPDTDWTQALEDRRRQLRMSSKTKPEEHPKFKDLCSRLDAAEGQGEAGASGVGEHGEEDDDEVQMMAQNTVTTCPYTQQEMEDPVTNVHCGHNYDRKGITQFLQNRPKAKCPIAGCSNLRIITMEDLKENKMLKKIIAEKKDKKQAKPRSHKN